jgi:hypothetical protein
MRIQDFWNQAFLAALTRLPANEARDEADRATLIGIEQWGTGITRRWRSSFTRKWRKTSIYRMPNTDFGDKVRKSFRQSKLRLICDAISKRFRRIA